MDVTNISLVVLIPTVIFLIVLFFFLGWYLNTKVGKKSLSAAEEKAKQIINDAQKESQNLKREKLLEVKDEWYKKKLDFDNDLNQKKQKYSNIEKQLSAREENIEKKFDLVLKKEKENRQLERELLNQKKDLDTKLVEIQKHEAEQNETSKVDGDSDNSLEKLTKKELQALAVEKGIELQGDETKDALIELLQNKQEN